MIKHTAGQAQIEKLVASTYRIATDAPESDGTLEWDATTLVVCEATAAGTTGFGYTYGDRAAATLIEGVLRGIVLGRDAMAVTAAWEAMLHAVRNLGRPGVCSHAIAAVDTALWDLKARLLGLPLVTLLGPRRSAVPVYASGGFTSYSKDRLRRQAADWVGAGIPRVKIKVGRDPDADLERVAAVREAVGAGAELFVDANGAYSRKQALEKAEAFACQGVTWFEEPVSSDDLEGLRLVRDRAPAGMEITAGEYGYDTVYFRRMLEAGAVDVLQVDVTRCAGISGLLEVEGLAAAHGTALSAHTAPALHTHVCCALRGLRHVEYFHDHVQIEERLFDDAPRPQAGMLSPDLSRPGMGLALRRGEAAAFAV